MEGLRSNRPIIWWLLTGCFLIFVMVVVGGITRLTHSGLSMVDWKLFMGTIPPLNEAEWLATFDQYKQFPEFQQLNSYFTLEDFKSIFFWEWLHRVLGRLLGLVFIVPFLIFWKQGRIKGRLLKQCLILLGLGAFQGFLGWFMVKSGLDKVPYVSHLRLAAHLITAFLTCAFTVYVAADLYHLDKPIVKGKALMKKYVHIFYALVVAQIVYGAFVAGLKAGLGYNTWPLMNDQFMADAVLEEKGGLAGLINGKAGVQFVHRWLAAAVFGWACYMWYKGMKLREDASNFVGIRMMLYFVILQFLLGVFTLIYAVPVSLGLAHQVVAFFLLMYSTYVMYRYRASSESLSSDS